MMIKRKDSRLGGYLSALFLAKCYGSNVALHHILDEKYEKLFCQLMYFGYIFGL